jgi:hypothetical protein
MGPGIRVDSTRTRRAEIMLGAGAAAEDAGDSDQPAEAEPAEEPATA